MQNKIQSQNISFEDIIKKPSFIFENNKVIKYYLLDNIYDHLIKKDTFLIDESCIVYKSFSFDNKLFFQFKDTEFTFIIENENYINDLKQIGYKKIMQNIEDTVEYVAFDSNGELLSCYEINIFNSFYKNLIEYKAKYPETNFVIENTPESLSFFENEKIKKSFYIAIKYLTNVVGLNPKKEKIFDELETMILKYANILKLDEKKFDFSIDSIKYLDLLFPSDKYSERDYHKHILFIILYCAKSYVYNRGGNLTIDSEGFIIVKEEIRLSDWLLIKLHPHENENHFLEYSDGATKEEKEEYKKTRVSAIFKMFCR